MKSLRSQTKKKKKASAKKVFVVKPAKTKKQDEPKYDGHGHDHGDWYEVNKICTCSICKQKTSEYERDWEGADAPKLVWRHYRLLREDPKHIPKRFNNKCYIKYGQECKECWSTRRRYTSNGLTEQMTICEDPETPKALEFFGWRRERVNGRDRYGRMLGNKSLTTVEEEQDYSEEEETGEWIPIDAFIKNQGKNPKGMNLTKKRQFVVSQGLKVAKGKRGPLKGTLGVIRCDQVYGGYRWKKGEKRSAKATKAEEHGTEEQMKVAKAEKASKLSGRPGSSKVASPGDVEPAEKAELMRGLSSGRSSVRKKQPTASQAARFDSEAETIVADGDADDEDDDEQLDSETKEEDEEEAAAEAEVQDEDADDEDEEVEVSQSQDQVEEAESNAGNRRRQVRPSRGGSRAGASSASTIGYDSSHGKKIDKLVAGAMTFTQDIKRGYGPEAMWHTRFKARDVTNVVAKASKLANQVGGVPRQDTQLVALASDLLTLSEEIKERADCMAELKDKPVDMMHNLCSKPLHVEEIFCGPEVSSARSSTKSYWPRLARLVSRSSRRRF